MAKNDVEAKIRLVVDNKTFSATLRQANKEARDFERQQRAVFGGVTGALKNAFGGAVGVIGKLAPALSASAGALAVAKKAMQENQSITDEWARVTEGAKASWEGFVDSIVNADFGSYFSNMGRMIQQARDAADAMDTLGTTQIFSSRAMSEYELKIRQARVVIKDPNSTAEQREAAGRTIEEAQAGKISTAQRLSDDYMQAFAAKLADYVSRKGINASASDFITRGEDGRWQIRRGSLFDKYYGNLATYEEAAARYAREKQLRSTVVGSVSMGQWGSQSIYGKGNMSDAEYEELRAFVEMSDDKLKELFGLFSSSRQELSRVYTEMTENFEYLNKAKGLTGGGGAGKGIVAQEGSIAYVQEQMKAATQEYEHAVTDAERKAAEARLAVLNEELNILKTGRGGEMGTTATGSLAALNVSAEDITPPKWRAGVKNYNELSATSNKSIETIKNLSDVINELGIVSNIVSPEVSKMINVLFKVIQMAAPSIPGPFGAILSVVGGIFGGGFATGGIVGGTSYKGDKLTAQVSSGEMILNRQQQRNLLSLASGGGGTPTVTGVEVHGDKMILLINNTLRGQGKHTIG